jgi:hypothetical protein
MIVAQQTTEPFTTAHDANGAASAVIIGSPQLLRRYHPIAQPLVRPLLMIVRRVLAHHLALMRLTERAHAVQGLATDRPHKPLREGIQVRALRGQPHRVHPHIGCATTRTGARPHIAKRLLRGSTCTPWCS